MPNASLRLLAGAAFSLMLAGAASAQMASDHSMSSDHMNGGAMAAGPMDHAPMTKPMAKPMASPMHHTMQRKHHKRHMVAGNAMKQGGMAPPATTSSGSMGRDDAMLHSSMSAGAMSSGAMQPH